MKEVEKNPINVKIRRICFHKTKSSHDTNCKILNQIMESQKAYYEDKIISIFEEISCLKKRISGILEKISEDNVKSEKDTQKDSEKLKNIALRIGITNDPKTSEEIKIYPF